jgi:hypothetical protein
MLRIRCDELDNRQRARAGRMRNLPQPGAIPPWSSKVIGSHLTQDPRPDATVSLTASTRRETQRSQAVTAAIFQRNDSSSEPPFCCKRGHSAILPPSFQFPPAKRPRPKRLHVVRLGQWRRIVLVLKSRDSTGHRGRQGKREGLLVRQPPALCRT